MFFKKKEVEIFAAKFFKEKETNENKSESHIYYATIKVDETGKYIEDTFGLSTLPWALHQLEKKKKLI